MVMPQRVPQLWLRILMVTALATLLACTASVETEGVTAQSVPLTDRLPAGAAAIAFIDYRDIIDTMPPEDWTEYEEMFEDAEDYRSFERFAEVIGIDLREDLGQLALAALPGDAGEEGEAVILVAATFDRSRLESTLSGVETVSYEGQTLYPLREAWAAIEEASGQPQAGEDPDEPSLDDQPGFLAILDGGTVALGGEMALKAAIDVGAGRAEGLSSDPLMSELVAGIPADSQGWFVARRESWQDQMSGLGESGGMVPADALSSIETVTMSMRFAEGMRLSLAGITGTADDARLLAESLSGLIGLGKMMMQQEEPELFQILDRGIRVSSEERTILIEANLTRADLDALRRLGEERAGSQPGF